MLQAVIRCLLKKPNGLIEVVSRSFIHFLIYVFFSFLEVLQTVLYFLFYLLGKRVPFPPNLLFLIKTTELISVAVQKEKDF